MTPTQRKRSAPADTSHDAALLDLIRAIAEGHDDATQHALSVSPILASVARTTGASRAEASPYFLEHIARYVYVGDTALHIAAAAYRSDLALLLLSHGADVRARNRRGATPLHDAVTGNPDSDRWNPAAQSEVVTRLIAAGADIDAADATGMTPLHRAVRTRCAAAVRALLAHGATTRRMNANGSTPLHLAVQATGRGGSGTPAALDEQAAIIRLLVASGAAPSDPDVHGKTVDECVTQERIRRLLHAPGI